ncbi:hypothetical protein BMS3Bbin05_01410 [bacterium BMS3Bbin05]|nr:hypothetical protein BMS3Bbin05_01410 [bacterium BMS3Bbin05]HDO22455.1 DUF4386 domain-containing protein [Nitrospirota bacterium]HDZ86996.1 DUF4386 domain-containing protein [Nitrospirota bacterium]
MTDNISDISLHVYARVAGLAYIVVIMLGIVCVSFVESSLVVPGDHAATFNNIIDNELRFRISIAGEILMYMLVVLLSLALYVVLKTVNHNLALLALLWRLGEAIIGGSVTVISGLIPLLLLNRDAAFEGEQLQKLIGLFLGVRNAGLDVVLMFIGVGGALFCYLLFKSKYIPKILAAWGIFTYLSMLILALTSILIPNISETIKMVFYAPGGLFEISIGLWLLIKGINTEQWNNRVPEAT